MLEVAVAGVDVMSVLIERKVCVSHRERACDACVSDSVVVEIIVTTSCLGRAGGEDLSKCTSFFPSVTQALSVHVCSGAYMVPAWTTQQTNSWTPQKNNHLHVTHGRAEQFGPPKPRDAFFQREPSALEQAPKFVGTGPWATANKSQLPLWRSHLGEKCDVLSLKKLHTDVLI